jgi:S-DNA-T family DNA segregation ATPase FtsK/SpoIIIE
MATNEQFSSTDALYDVAARLVVSSPDQPRTSQLQRHFGIGFSRAARLLDMMQEDGLVSACNGIGQRTVLVERDYFVKVDAQVAAAGERS